MYMNVYLSMIILYVLLEPIDWRGDHIKCMNIFDINVILIYININLYVLFNLYYSYDIMHRVYIIWHTNITNLILLLLIVLIVF